MSTSDPATLFQSTVQPALEQLGWGGEEFTIQSTPIYMDAQGSVFACMIPASPPLVIALQSSTADGHGRSWLANLGYSARASLAVSLSSQGALLIAPHMIPVADRGKTDQTELTFSSEFELPPPYVLRQVESTDPGQALRQLGVTPMEAVEAAARGGIYESPGFRPRDPVDRALMDHLIGFRTELLREEPVETASAAEYFHLDKEFLRLVGIFIFIRALEDRRVHPSLPYGSLLALAQANDVATQIRRFTEPIRRLYGVEAIPHLDHSWQSADVVRRLVRVLYVDPKRRAKLNFALLDEDVLSTLYQEYLAYLLTSRQESAQARLIGNDDRRRESVRRKLGIYYTPRALVDIVRSVIDSEIPPGQPVPTILDPACGAGAFLRPVLLWMRGRWPQISTQEVAEKVVGIDEDPRAVTLARQALSRTLLQFTEGRIPELSISQADFLDQVSPHTPEGWRWKQQFDVAVGNPPFLSHAEMRKLDPERAEKLRRDFAPVVGRETNLAAYFLYQSLHALRPGGLLGMVVPRILLRGDNYEQLRRELLRKTEIVAVVDFGVEQVFSGASITTALLFVRRRAQDLEHPTTMTAPSVFMLRYREDFAPLIARALQGSARTAEIDGVLLKTSCRARPDGPWLLLSEPGEKAEALLTTGNVEIDSVLKMEYAVDIMAGNGKALLFDEQGDKQSPVARLWSHYLSEEVLIERELLRSAVRSENIERFRLKEGGPRTYVLYPYGLDGQPISEEEVFGGNTEFVHAANLLKRMERDLKAVKGRTTGVWYGPRNIRPSAVWHHFHAREGFANTMLVRRRTDRISRTAPVPTTGGVPIGALLTFAVRREYAADTERFLAFLNSSLMSWYQIMTAPEFGRGGYFRTSLASFRPLRFPTAFFDADPAPLRTSLAVLSNPDASVSPAQILRLEKRLDDWVYSALGFDDLLRERIRSEVLSFTANAAPKNPLYESVIRRAGIETALEVGSA